MPTSNPTHETAREPLGALSLNTPAHRIPSTPSSAASAPVSGPGSGSGSTRKLAPIFLNSEKRRTPTSDGRPQLHENVVTASATGSGGGSGGASAIRYTLDARDGSPVSKKRVRLDSSHAHTGAYDLTRDSSGSSSTSISSSSSASATSGLALMEIDYDVSTNDAANGHLGHTVKTGQGHGHGHVRMHSIHDWFLPSSSSTYERVKEAQPAGPSVDSGAKADAHAHAHAGLASRGVWRRGRRRLGVRAGGVLELDKQILSTPQDPFLSTLVTSILPYHPLIPPSLLLLPSIHPPTGRPRDFAPPLSLAFSNSAKTHDVPSARAAGVRRLIAVAGEEGGVRILDTDEGLGGHREEKGFWWRAHGNAVFDLKWSGDDTRILTASGDQSTRLHALAAPTPTLLATLRGHTSSVKTATFFDPSRSSIDASESSVIATGGRDGNILIYDIRCQGRRSTDELPDSPVPPYNSRRSSRERYADGVPGFAAQSGRGMELDPVMTIKGAHGDGRRSGSGRTATRSVTSLVALQSMPGILASGGSFDGIVKLWDLRFPAPTTRSPEPRPTCTAVGSLPDPTILGNTPSRRARSINALCESPTTGDLYALCGDSAIHSLRPSFAISNPAEPVSREAIGLKTYTDPKLLVSSFYIRIAISPDGRYLSSGSCRGGAMTWDTRTQSDKATRLGMGMGGVVWPEGKEREVCAVDWGKDMLAASSDDLATRIWRSNREASRWLKDDPVSAGAEWIGTI